MKAIHSFARKLRIDSFNFTNRLLSCLAESKTSPATSLAVSCPRGRCGFRFNLFSLFLFTFVFFSFSFGIVELSPCQMDTSSRGLSELLSAYFKFSKVIHRVLGLSLELRFQKLFKLITGKRLRDAEFSVERTYRLLSMYQ